MYALPEIAGTLVEAPPQVLALIVGLAAIGLAAFAIYVVHTIAQNRERD